MLTLAQYLSKKSPRQFVIWIGRLNAGMLLVGRWYHIN